MKISATLLYTCALLSAVYAQQGGKKTPFSCPSQGFHADPRSCSVFYRCFDARSNYHLRNSYYPVSPKLYAYKFRCSEGTVFEPLENSCVPASKSSRYECRDSVLSRQRKDPTGSCEQEGFFGVYGECRKFYRCVGTGTGKYIKYDFECGTGTVWDTDNNVCNHAWATRRSDCGQQQTASGSDPSQSGSGSQSSNGHTTQRPESQTSQSTYTSRPTTSSTSRPTTYTTSRPTTYMTSRQTFQTSDQQTATTTTTAHPDYGPLEPDPETNEIQTSDNAPSQTCQSEGFFPTRGDCKKFYRCVSSGNAAYIRYDFECGEGTYWDAENNVCNHKYAVRRNCDDVGESAASSTTASAAITSSESESESTTQSSTAAQEVSTTSSETDQGSPAGSSTTTSNEQTSSTGSTVPSSSSTSDQEISGNDIVTSSTVSTTTEKQTSGSGGTTTSTSTTVGIQQTSDPSVSTATTEFTSISEGASTSSSTSQSTESPSSVAESTTSATAQQNSSSNNSAPCNNQTQSQAAEISCPSAGYYPHPSDCKKFYRCVDWDGDKGQRFSVYHFDCPEGTIFDPALDVCNHEESVYPKRQCATPAKNSTEQTTTQKTESTTSSSETTTQSSVTENTTPPIGESETGTAGHASTTAETTITTEVAGNETVTSDQDSSTIIHTTDGSDHTTTPVGTTSATADTTAVTDHITMAATTTSDTDDTTTPANHPTTGESTNPSEHTTLAETTSATDHTTAAETTSVTEYTTSAETTRVTGHTTVAETTSVNEQSTVAGNEHTTQAQTEHTTQAETEHTTQAETEHTTQSENEHTTQAETEHTTQSETEHTTQAETEHTTQAETEHTTQAGTEHTTQSETEHTTQAETTKITEHTTEAETTSTSESSTTPAGNTTGIQQCEVADLEEDQIVLVCPTGFRRHPKNCQLFYQCTTSSNNEIKVLVLSCPNNTVFDEKKIQCLPPEEAASCNSRSRSKRTIEGVTMADEGEICPSEGHYPYHQDCLKFFKCRKSRHGRMQGYLYQCPRGYAYWDVSKRCEKMHKIPSCASRDILPDVPVESKEIGSRSLSLEL